MVGTVKTALNKLLIKQCAAVSIHLWLYNNTSVCQRSLVYSYKATRNIELDKTFWTGRGRVQVYHNKSDLEH